MQLYVKFLEMDARVIARNFLSECGSNKFPTYFQKHNKETSGNWWSSYLFLSIQASNCHALPQVNPFM